MDRRKLLKVIGASSALSAIPTVSTAEADGVGEFKQTVEKAAEIRANTGKETMKRWLENQPVNAGFNSYKLPISLGAKADNIGTEKIKDGNIIIDMGLYQSYYTQYVAATLNFYYDLKLNVWNARKGCGTEKVSYGENPKDAAAMVWNTDQYEAISHDRFEATNGFQYVETHAPFRTGQIGADIGKIGFRIDDYQASADWIDIDDLKYNCDDRSKRVYAGQASLYLYRRGDYDQSERLVKGGYDHVYNASSPNVGATLSIPPSAGVTLIGGNEDIDERTVIQDRNGDEIAVTGDEVETGP